MSRHKITAFLIVATAILLPLSSSASSASCPSLSRGLVVGSRGSEVTSLQTFLATQGVFTVAPTGYFGPITQKSVQVWQAAQGIVSAGTPASTGFGSVGPKTRAAIVNACSQTSVNTATITTSTSATTKLNIPIPIAVAPMTCASGFTQQHGQCVAVSCPVVQLACLTNQHIEYNGCTPSCVANPPPADRCTLSCAVGYHPSGPTGSCNQQCLADPTVTSPSLSVTESPTSVVEGGYQVTRGTATIAWTTTNAPSGSAVFLYLVTNDANANQLFITAQQPTSGSYTWNEPGPVCAADGCSFSLGGPGSYYILAQLYTPLNACYGDICPALPPIMPTIITLATSSPFIVTAP